MQNTRQTGSRASAQREALLKVRPLARHRGRSKIQVAIRRAFLGHTFRTSSEIFAWALVGRREHWRRWDRWSVTRRLREVADRVGRSDGPYRPYIWRLKPEVSLPADVTRDEKD